MTGNSRWWKIPTTIAMTEREYDANLRGMNILFGAVLGFVLAGTNQLPQADFAMVLLFSASVVILILYMAHSDYKLFYAATVAATIAALPIALEEALEIAPIPQLQPTLAVWALMVLVVEMMPREKISEIKEKEQ